MRSMTTMRHTCHPSCHPLSPDLPSCHRNKFLRGYAFDLCVSRVCPSRMWVLQDNVVRTSSRQQGVSVNEPLPHEPHVHAYERAFTSIDFQYEILGNDQTNKVH